LTLRAPILRPPILRPWAVSPRLAVGLAVGLLLASLSIAAYTERLANAQKLREVGVQAEILAGSVAGALAFDDAAVAREYLAALKANHDVEAAGVYDVSGRLVAGYARRGASLPQAFREQRPQARGAHMSVTTPVTLRSARLGSVYLQTAAEPLDRRALRYAGVGLVILMGALVVGGFGASNALLADAHRKLQVEMEERAKAETALRESQKQEAAAQLAIATERGRAALAQSEQRLEFALDAGRLGSWELDFKTGRLAASEHFKANFGLGPDEPLESYQGLLARIHPEDLDRRNSQIMHADEPGGELEAEFRTLAPDGQTRWMLIRGRAQQDKAGRPARAAGVSMDITARKQAEQRQRLLLDELNHRVKNTLATVQSIAAQTSRTVERPELFEPLFKARIEALAHAHELLSDASWEGASLTDVVSRTLAPYAGDGRRVKISGPGVRLGPNAAITLNMAFHELATNAAKYGALCEGKGRVEVGWSLDRQPEGTWVDILWRERGGPKVAKPSRRGFGSRLIEQGLAREFDGEVRLAFEPDGLTCRMRLPLSVKLREAA
jgi:PAS domain S-box-containing protein